MNATESMPSPVSPYTGQSKQTFSAPRPYPATPAPEQSMSPQHQPQQHQPQQQEQNRGLGLSYSMPPSSTISPIMASPHSEWSHSPNPMHQPQLMSSSQPPDHVLADTDPFYGYSAATNTGLVGPHSPEAPGLDYCSTPPSSNMQSHRGSVSSGAPSEASGEAYTPRPIKGEEGGGEWYQVPDIRAMSQAPLPYPNNTNTLNSAEDILYRPQSDWPMKQDSTAYISAGLHPHPHEGRLPPIDSNQQVVPSTERTKPKREKTRPEEATHECSVCGKLFKRSYNYKSHLDTHNPDRKYPHPCTYLVGASQCTKKFQRKTDLDRHIDSVHLKNRTHKCHLCGNRFARKDTLRRHSEDGCPKRFEFQIREGGHANGSAAAPATAPQRQFPFQSPIPDFSGRPRAFSHTPQMPPPLPVSTGSYSMYSSPATAYRQ